MRVTLFRDLPSERWPSMERYADELSKELPQISSAVQVTAYVSDAPIAPRGRAAMLTAQLWRSTIYPLAARRRQGDLNHVIDHSYAHLVHFLNACKTIVTCHDLAPLALRDGGGRGLSTRLWDWAFAGMLKAAHIVCDSGFTASELQRFSRFPTGQISVVPLGVDLSFHRIADRDQLNTLRISHRLPTDRPLLLHVGHCGARKNLEGLIAALRIVKGTGRPFHFVQIGGQFTAAQRALIAACDLQTNITQVTFVAERDLPAWYNLADLFVFPSRYEGFGLPVLEAMACGTPVVASSGSSLREVVGDAGLLVDPQSPRELAEAMRAVLTDTTLAATLRAMGFKQAAQFTWERCARATLTVYQSIAEQI